MDIKQYFNKQLSSIRYSRTYILLTNRYKKEGTEFISRCTQVLLASFSILLTLHLFGIVYFTLFNLIETTALYFLLQELPNYYKRFKK